MLTSTSSQPHALGSVLDRRSQYLNQIRRLTITNVTVPSVKVTQMSVAANPSGCMDIAVSFVFAMSAIDHY